MKNVLIIFLFICISVQNIFAYTPSKKDTSIINSTSYALINIIERNQIPAETYVSRLLSFKYIFWNTNQRFSYIFGQVANIIDKEISKNQINDGAKKLKVPIGDKIYFGAFPDFGGAEDIVSKKRIQDFEKLTNKDIAWAYFSQNWYNGISYPKKSIQLIHDLGITPFVRLMARDDLEQYHNNKYFSMQNIIDGKFDKRIRQRAKDAKKDNIPLLMEFGTEMNGDWFPRNGVYNGGATKNQYGDIDYFDGPERFRDAYRHIIDIFKDEQSNNITWFFHPDIYSNPEKEWNKAKYYYPGNDYIDWIGVSIYGPLHPHEDYWETFSEILKNRYKSIEEISNDKPIALLEFGVCDDHPLGDKKERIEDAFETILDNPYIDFKAISYWHENWKEEDGLFARLRIDSSIDSLKTFRKYIYNKRFINKIDWIE